MLQGINIGYWKCKDYVLKIVIAVHLYGLNINLGEIKSIYNEYDVPLIEDIAVPLLITLNEKYIGTFSDYRITSFNGNNSITSSNIGMLFNIDETKEKRQCYI